MTLRGFGRMTSKSKTSLTRVKEKKILLHNIEISAVKYQNLASIT